jgi:Cytochrome c7 and related cytochrome c
MSPRVKGVLIVLATAGLACLFGFLYSTGSSDLRSQDIQPLDFSHEMHAGHLKIECMFCHRHAAESTTAGIPTVSLCMGCHQSIEPATPDMGRLAGYWRDQKPIEWVRLQRLPDFVYFTHAMHLKAGLQCGDCHGRVATMRQTPRAPSFEMGWCLSCHSQRGASRDCWTCHK